uniref:ATP synthase complex subunit 8 n=1 Tax=Anthrenus verbasci TaxID=295669 RepID=A0A343C225_9COLE
MPQMAPMNWLTLFITFSFIFLMTNSLNFFSLMYITIKKKTEKSKNMTNWKW